MSEVVHSAICDWTGAVVDASWLPDALRLEVLAKPFFDPVVQGLATVACLDDSGCVETTFNARYWFDEDLVITVACSSGTPTTPMRLAPRLCGNASPSAASALNAVED